MANSEPLIDLSNDNNRKRKADTPASSKYFGILTHDCNVTEVTSIDELTSENLKLGTLIQIQPDYKPAVDKCYFKVRDFDKWHQKYKTAIYKCSKDDYIAVNSDVWPYLLAIKNDASRLKFVENVNRNLFSLDMFMLNNEIRIAGPRERGTNPIYYDFVIRYVGLVKEIGTGYYIGIEKKSPVNKMPAEYRALSRYYKYGGEGIIVPADWIMINLYNGEISTTKKTDENDNASTSLNFNRSNEPVNNNHLIPANSNEVEKGEEAIETICDPKPSLSSTLLGGTETPAETKGIVDSRQLNAYSTGSSTGAIPKQKRDNNISQSPTPFLTQIEEVTNTKGCIRNVESSSCDKCSNKLPIKQGVVLRECLHTFCVQCLTEHIQKHLMKPSIRCPFKKDYVCNSDIWASEIKELCGDQIYNKISQNSVLGLMPQVNQGRKCRNEKCTHIWPNGKSNHANFEKCPSCKISWCNVCSSAHDAGTKHGSAKPPIKCCKCQESIHSAKECVLKKCNHIFCKDCATAMITSQTSSATDAKCTICQVVIDDQDVIKFTGQGVLNLFLDNRKTASIPKLCKCQKKNEKCGVVLTNCKHNVCRLFLTELLQEQTIASCPICLQIIEDYQVQALVPKDNTRKTEQPQHVTAPKVKCDKCKKTDAEMNLEVCQHAFCKKCVREFIMKQGNKPDCMFINCAICDVRISDCDISTYSSKQVLSKIAAAKRKDTLNGYRAEGSNKCRKCSAQTDINLEICKHPFCKKCLRDFITEQAYTPKTMVITCAVCPHVVTDTEIKMYSSEDVMARLRSKTKVPSCSTCNKNINSNQGIALSRCAHQFCTDCLNEFLQLQISNNLPPACRVCQKELDKFEIDKFAKKFVNSQMVKLTRKDCLRCDEQFEENEFYNFQKCNHSICRNCAKSTILEQIKIQHTPTCPFCKDPLEASEIASFVNDVPINMQTTSQQILSPTESICNTFECVICDETINLEQQIKINKCSHDMCRNCFNEKVEQQLSIKKPPSCPLCAVELDHNALPIQLTNLAITPKANEHFDSSEYENKCLVCRNSILMRVELSKCNHAFCRGCLHTNIEVQESKKLPVTCPYCRVGIDSAQVNELKKYLPSINSVQTASSHAYDSNHVKPLQPNNSSFECVVCDMRIEAHCGITLSNCNHNICRDCISETVIHQLSSAVQPKCPLCPKPISDDEIKAIGNGAYEILMDIRREQYNLDCLKQFPSTSSIPVQPGPSQGCNNNNALINVNKSSFECPICEKYIELQCGIVLNNCGHSICRDCSRDVVVQQLSSSVQPKCPLCPKLLSDYEIKLIDNSAHDMFIENREQQIKLDEEKQTLSTSCNEDFRTGVNFMTCIICEEEFTKDQTVALQNCVEGCVFCRKCISDAINDQVSHKKSACCPLCSKDIYNTEVIELCGTMVLKKYLDSKRPTTNI